jgi:hypothetical protein
MDDIRYSFREISNVVMLCWSFMSGSAFHLDGKVKSNNFLNSLMQECGIVNRLGFLRSWSTACCSFNWYRLRNELGQWL